MAFDPKLIPLFDGTDAGQSVVEWVEKAELVCRLSRVKNIECVVPMRLSGGAYAVYQQLSEEKRADFACIKDVLYTAFALSPVMACKQSLIFKKLQKPLKLEGLCDADWANLNDRKIVSGYFCRLAKDNPMI